jgi:hypothetical protein
MINKLVGVTGYAIVRADRLAILSGDCHAASSKAVQAGDPRALQDIAIERYLAAPQKLPEQFFPFEKALMLSPREVAKALTLGVIYANTSDVKGDIAEFGTMSGFSAKIIANAMMYDLQRQPSYPFRTLRLFDSFEGLPEITADADKTSPQVLSGAWAKGGCKVLSAKNLYNLITKIIPPERVEIIEGWFSETVTMLPDDTRFAMIHFDGDLYQSMMDALTPCFAKGFVSRGAVLCFDDWNCNQASPAFGERKAWAELVAAFGIDASHSGDYGETGTKFIVHSYRGMP